MRQRSEQGCTKPRSLHFVWWCLIFVVPQYGTFLKSRFWRPEFWVGSYASVMFINRGPQWLLTVLIRHTENAPTIISVWNVKTSDSGKTQHKATPPCMVLTDKSSKSLRYTTVWNPLSHKGYTTQFSKQFTVAPHSFNNRIIRTVTLLLQFQVS